MKKQYVYLTFSILFFMSSVFNSYSLTNLDDIKIDDLLNEDHTIWQTDSDNDGLCDAIEKILNTNPDKKDTDNDGLEDKIELELGLNPNKLDSIGNGIMDSLEDCDHDGISNIDEIKNNTNPSLHEKIYTYIYKGFSRENISVTPNTLIESCKLVYNDMAYEIIGKKVSEIFPNQYKRLHDFTVIKYSTSSAFCAIALKNKDTIIVAYQATKTSRDWAENFLTQFMPHPQRDSSIEFIKPLLNGNDKIYITGHSLGGLLTQYTCKYLTDIGYTNFTASTFNSASSMNPKHIKGEVGPPIIKKNLLPDYIKTYEYVLSDALKKNYESKEHLIVFINKSISENGFIDLSNKKWSDMDFEGNFNTNYIINKDPLYVLVGGGYLGTKNVLPSTTILAADNDYSGLWNYHSLDNFSGYREFDKNIK